MHERRSSAPGFPDAEPVGPHLVIDRTEWVPGSHPDPRRREEGQAAYPESYFRCIRCGAERLRKRDFPAACDAVGDRHAAEDRDDTAGSTAGGEPDGSTGRDSRAASPR